MNKEILYSTSPEDFYYMDRNVPCQSACPASTNVPAYIRALFEERYGRSYEINRAANLFPGVLGRICSRPCEAKCRHGEPELGQPVNICHIKRAAYDFKREVPISGERPAASLGKRVAVVGAGPAGLAAGYDLSTIGFAVTIFEALEKPGGMLRYGIPEFRLPRNVLEEEIQQILDSGIRLKTGVKIGQELAIADLLKENDAVLVAAGCYRSLRLDISGEDLPGVYPGLDFMMGVCFGRPSPVGKKVLVLGAGFTAFDCARSALRLGAEDVTICIRRTEEDLAVTKDEIHETKKEGVKIATLMISQKIIGKDRVEGVQFLRTRPDERRSDGKRGVSPIEGSDFVLPADSIIVATGQRPEPITLPFAENKKGLLIGNKADFSTPLKGLYVAGDYLTGPSTVIESIAMGRRAAEKIARDLTGTAFRERVVRMEDAEITDRNRTWDYIPRQEMPTAKPLEERLRSRALEVETGLTGQQAREESKRCYLCYLHYEIDISRCIYCRYCIDVAPRDCIRLVQEIKTNEAGAITGFVETNHWRDVNAIVIDNARCIRCGECMRVCPVSCISATKVELTERRIA
jgi:glutamate synthase (NADPH/NADH) small chain